MFQCQRPEERMIRQFRLKSKNKVLTNCYENKIRLGCKYNQEIEKEIEKYSKDIEEYPWWVTFLS